VRIIAQHQLWIGTKKGAEAYMKLDGFILGLSNGVACIATCAPFLIPYLLGEGKGIVRNYWVTGQFLFGRLLGYLLFAVLAWAISSAILQEAGRRDLIIGVAYILFSGLLIFYGFFRREPSCGVPSASTGGCFPKSDILLKNTNKNWNVFKRDKAACNSKRYQRLLSFQPALLPAAAGFATGLSFCPPFLLAFTGAAEQTSLFAALLFFFSFFLGTSLLFVLVPFVGAFSRFSVLQIIGKMASGMMGLYYLYSGSIMLIGGLKVL
jgi:sulfite exporter TauE/SafE